MERPALKANALFIPIRQLARLSVGSCIVLIICVMLSDVNLHYLTFAARCSVSGCWPSCLSLCLFVRLLNVRVCAPDFAMKVLQYRNDFDTVG